MILYCLSPLMFLGHIIIGLIAVTKSSVNVYWKRKCTGKPAQVIGGILLVGGLLALISIIITNIPSSQFTTSAAGILIPLILSLVGFLALIISIIIGFIYINPKEVSSQEIPGLVELDGGFQVEPSPTLWPPDGSTQEALQPDMLQPEIAPNSPAGSDAIPLGEVMDPSGAEAATMERPVLPEEETAQPDGQEYQPRPQRPMPDTWTPSVEEPAPAVKEPIPSGGVSEDQAVSIAYLDVDRGDLERANYPIRSGSFIIGRGRDVNLQLRDPKVSRHHAVIRYANGMWFIQDPGSTSGFEINGQPVKASKLESGDKIAVIHYLFTFRTSR